MHVLLVNDDGPLDDKTCPYIKYMVDEIQRSTDWKLSICVPNQQRSWIGKAHFAGKPLKRTYLYTKNSTEEFNEKINEYEGPFDSKQSLSGYQEWNLIDSTPAACTDIGLNHIFEDIDLVISGPNFGKNSSNLYILASGTVGSAMEAVLHNKKSIAVSYSYSSTNHTFDEIKTASVLAVKLIQKLYNNWNDGVELYTMNVPLNQGLSLQNTKCYFAPIMDNKWGHSIYEAVSEDSFVWNPNFKKVYKDGLRDFSHSDNRILLNNNISVTPLKAKFQQLEPLFGEISLSDKEDEPLEEYLLLDINPSSYLYESFRKAFEGIGYHITSDKGILKSLPGIKVFHYAEYEDLDLDLIEAFPQNYYICSNIYRKGLIRKNYLSNMIHQYSVKNPKSILASSYPVTYQFELDYAEFLDDALDESYELREEVNSNNKYWILKPSMSDKGQGIRLFKTIDQLQEIFNSFEEGEDSDVEEEDDDNNGIITSQLRQFIVQEYQQNPLLLPEYDNKKFHFRVYVVANGDLQVFVYRGILALFATQPFVLQDDDTGEVPMGGHLTNTCLQNETPIVESFWNMKGIDKFDKEIIYNRICQIVGEVFKAATSIDKINFQPLGNATEFYGVDFIIDNNMQLKLLEVNAYPDFKQTGEALHSIIHDLLEATVHEVIAPSMSGTARVPQDSVLTEVYYQSRS
ncbi:putative tubulin--tyrosine ligase pby1 [Yamadazyma tenuis]|uniref:Survival protein SurE-like phosphatase/nucleotidase domain-containing protein n=1 Tax=Candida tenuis (strain ATCC 10573 / BCRC 21748 / CBS 615 / JCM 9827 / NBRC 10315 / NRRL Y-1498 / VKM Y-70) TaxID=590646 RepID=G3BCH4_CANTC|nr:uncharacterized protein CANTEDRAFT_127122 [Yamadazyma tenuis ATCC 10573]EGV60160.1 hypothetical protein CANTEDRAFT_127122 [Yamadazyma tenuis ATCC 10573]WEJ94600.1 putative tubulin--tyrosine ligase pby1 [Yamadazyma tenuis]